MRKRFKILVGLSVVGVLFSSAAVAATANWPSPNAGAAAITTTSAPPVAQAPESIDTTTTAPAAITNGTSAGPNLKDIQQKLNDLGYWAGPVDGLSGQATQQALLAFQKVQGLSKSGAADAATVAALATAARPAPANVAGDVIEVDKTRQIIMFVRGGQTLWVFNTSTGTERSYSTNGVKGFAHTPTGTFKVLRSVDGVDPGPLGALYRPRYFTNTGIAIHGAGQIPATPASHGCARVSNGAMDFIWQNKLMPIGALVWVYDDPAKQPFAGAAANATTTSAAPTTSTVPAVSSAPAATAPPVTKATAAPTTAETTTTSTTTPPTTSADWVAAL